MSYKKTNFSGRTVTSVSEEKTLNPRLTKPREDFIKIMNGLGLPYPKKIGKMFLHILIWRLFIWDTLEIKYRMVHRWGKWFNRLEINLFSCTNVNSINLTNFKCRIDKKWAYLLIQFNDFLFGIHWRSSTKWCTRGANDLTGSRWTCLVVQMSTPSIWRISNSVVSHHFFQSVLGSELELLRTLAWICRVPPESCFNALQATSYDIELH